MDQAVSYNYSAGVYSHSPSLTSNGSSESLNDKKAFIHLLGDVHLHAMRGCRQQLFPLHHVVQSGLGDVVHQTRDRLGLSLGRLVRPPEGILAESLVRIVGNVILLGWKQTLTVSHRISSSVQTDSYRTQR